MRLVPFLNVECQKRKNERTQKTHTRTTNSMLPTHAYAWMACFLARLATAGWPFYPLSFISFFFFRKNVRNNAFYFALEEEERKLEKGGLAPRHERVSLVNLDIDFAI